MRRATNSAKMAWWPYLQARRQLTADALLHLVIEAVKDFSSGEQADDITLIVAKAKCTESDAWLSLPS